jgi:hypothetical protein
MRQHRDHPEVGLWRVDTRHQHNEVLAEFDVIEPGTIVYSLAWCPVLTAGSTEMLTCWLDVNDALAAAGLWLPDYGAEARYSRWVSA